MAVSPSLLHGSSGASRGPLGFLRRLSSFQEAGLLLVIVLMGLTLIFAGGDLEIRGQTVNNFFRLDNLIPNVATPMSWFAIMALGSTMVIISGGIDLSVGSIMAAAALAGVAVLQRLPEDASPWTVWPLALAVPLGVGLLCGVINGALVVSLRMHPFIVTLGTLYMYRGIALVAVPMKTLPSLDHKLPTAFTEGLIAWRFTYGATGARHFVQPVPMILMLLCALAAWIYLSHTVGGRELYAVGDNEEAARFSGLRVGWIKLRVYALSGLSAGIAGMITAGYYGSVSTNTAFGYELTVIAAAVVGGASLVGGRGTALGAILGALIIQLIDNGIFVLRAIDIRWLLPLAWEAQWGTLSLSKEYAKIINGLAIIIAVAIDRLSQRLGARRLARQAQLQAAPPPAPEGQPAAPSK